MMQERILETLQEINNHLKEILPKRNLWLTPKAALSENVVPLARDSLYKELNLAMYCYDNNIPCDLIFGIHFVDSSRTGIDGNVTNPRYKINVPLFCQVVSRTSEKRVPTRPLADELKEAIARLN